MKTVFEALMQIPSVFMNKIFNHRHDGLDDDGHAPIDYAADTGAANAYAIALVPALTAYIPGLPVHFKAANANTGASTLNINGLGPIAIKKNYNAALVADDIKAGQMVSVMYDGVNLQMLSSTQQVFVDTDTDVLCSVSANDTTAGYLNGKLVAGAGVSFTENNNGANETLEIKLTAGQAKGDYIKVLDSKAAGTAGGTFTSGAWQTRDINTEEKDTGGICSINANQITLAAGTYQCLIAAPAYKVNNMQAKLRNITDGTDTLIGSSSYSDTGTSIIATSLIRGEFTIAAQKVFEIQNQCATTRNADGFGLACNFGVAEIYTVAEFWRVK